MLTKRALLETAALATVAAAGTAPRTLIAQERVAQAATQSSQSDEIRARDAQSEDEWYYSVGIQNYVFTLPLTMLERERKLRLNPVGSGKGKEVCTGRAHQPDRPYEDARNGRRHHALHAKQ